MSLTLHHCHEARSMRSLWLLYELGIPFDLVIHEFGKELRSDDYLSKHPLGRVPSLEVDGKPLFETGAITEYLCETYPNELWRPPHDLERMEWLQWLHYGETVAVHGASLTQQHIVIYEDKDRSPMVMKLESKRLEKALEVLDKHLQGREYLLSTFSAVDISVAYSAFVAKHFVDVTQFENLTAWMARLEAREAYQKSLPPEGATLIYRRPFYPAPA